MLFIVITLLLCVTNMSSSKPSGHKLQSALSDEFIDELNSYGSTWRAKRNIHPDAQFHRIVKLAGSLMENDDYLDDEDFDDYDENGSGDGEYREFDYNSIETTTFHHRKHYKDIPVLHHEVNITIPDSFDAREKWPGCPSIGKIRDQSICGSCWAFTTTEVITDRICIHSNGISKPEISAEDLMTCGASYSTLHGDGCDGGSTSKALQYWVDYGISTGGGFGSRNGCKSYAFKSCEDDREKKNRTRPLCPTEPAYAPSCVRSCDEGVQDVYERTLHFGEKVYRIAKREEQIQMEILNNGPVSAIFMVYADFIHYHYGIYRHLMGADINYHAIKIIGWGAESGTPYWLVANSYNEEWGENGFFKILRGSNECQIENFVFGGIPKINRN